MKGGEYDICPDCGRALRSTSGLCHACLWAGLDGADGTLDIPDLEISTELARGGMGVVYRAREHGAGRDVAVKMMLTSLAETPGARERFAQEARAMGTMDHPGILPVYRVGEHNGLPFFTMKLARGGTLAARRTSLGARWKEIAALLADIADAVDHAHRHGLLHRDLKPANILFDDDGRAFVSDFGLVKIANGEDGITQTIAMLGTPSYLAPEVAARDARAASVASDVWSLGAMLHELLAGRLPFEADGIPSLLRRIVEDEPAGIPEAPRDLVTISRKCLRKNPRERYASAAELAGDLRSWLEGGAISARRATMPERLRSWARRNPALAASLAVLALAVGVVIFLQARAGRDLLKEKTAAISAQADALAAQVTAARMAGRIDQRDTALSAARQVAALRLTDELRDDAISLLATPGWREEGAVEIDSPAPLLFSANVAWAINARDGGLALYRTADGMKTEIPPPEGAKLGGVVALSPDGNKATAWDTSGTFWDFERASGKWNRRFKHEKHGSVLVWSESGGRFAAFDTASKRTTIFAGTDEVPVGTETARPKAFSPDGSLLAVEDGSELAIFDAHSGAMKHRVALRPAAVGTTSIKWRADGRALAVVSGRTELEVVYLDGDAPLIELLPASGVADAAWHPSGEWIATTNADGTLRISETTGRREILRAPVVAGQIEFSADGSKLVAREKVSGKLHRFTFTAPSCVHQTLLPRPSVFAEGKELPTPPWGCAISADGAVGVATGPLALEWIDTASGRLAASGPSGIFWKVAMTDNRLLALGRQAGAAPVLGTYAMRQSGGTFEVGKPKAGSSTVFGFASSANGQALCVESGKGLVFAKLDSPAQRSIPLQSAPPFTGTAFPGPSSISPDGRWIVVSSIPTIASDSIAIWDTTKPEEQPRRLPGFSAASGFAFSPDSGTLFVHSDEKLIALTTGSWSAKWTVPRGGRSFSLCLLAISGDGKLLAAAASPNGIALHDTATGRRLALLRHPDLRPFGALALDHTGNTLLATGIPPSVQTWNIANLRAQLAELGMDWDTPRPLPQKARNQVAVKLGADLD